MRCILLLLFHLFFVTAFSQQEIFDFLPFTNIESTQSLGYKPNSKTVVETINYRNAAFKTIRKFNEKGYLIACDEYDLYDNLEKSTNYLFEDNKLMAIEKLFPTIDIDLNDNISTYVEKTAHYTYNNDNRLKSYEVINEDITEENSVFHVIYPSKNKALYYLMNDKDSILVAEIDTIIENKSKIIRYILDWNIYERHFNANNDKIKYLAKSNQGEMLFREESDVTYFEKQKKTIRKNFDGEDDNPNRVSTTIFNEDNQISSITETDFNTPFYDYLANEINASMKVTEISFQRESTETIETTTEITTIKYLDNSNAVISKSSSTIVKSLDYTFY